MLQELKSFYKKHGRHDLPWRKTYDPYKILVSEVMLQQTQVERVVPHYGAFIKKFPTASRLAVAPLSRVLAAWQGLGYNRRAKHLLGAARVIAKGGFPKKVEDIETLPGVGRYTARAVAAFAFNKPESFVETNIRTVIFHHYGGAFIHGPVGDAELLPLIADLLKKSRMKPRDFYAAMMDYGAHLKKQGVRLNAKSTHYRKQNKFEGSARQLRGAILRELLKHQATLAVLSHKIPRSKEQVALEVARLVSEGLVAAKGKTFAISDK
ncbi:MAG: A/G-specific adenine glycosylase [Patescibacteria group bacterium]